MVAVAATLLALPAGQALLHRSRQCRTMRCRLQGAPARSPPLPLPPPGREPLLYSHKLLRYPMRSQRIKLNQPLLMVLKAMAAACWLLHRQCGAQLQGLAGSQVCTWLWAHPAKPFPQAALLQALQGMCTW